VLPLSVYKRYRLRAIANGICTSTLRLGAATLFSVEDKQRHEDANGGKAGTNGERIPEASGYRRWGVAGACG
jgi:hypothetical protein